MAINLNSSSNSEFGSSRKRRYSSEINVTPMVDVMLVLLIIFMIASPMLVGGVQVDLPKTSSSAVSTNLKPLIISIDKDSKIYIFESLVEKKDLVSKLREILKASTEGQNQNEAIRSEDVRVFVKGDKSVAYGMVAEVMSLIQNAGYTKVALISEME